MYVVAKQWEVADWVLSRTGSVTPARHHPSVPDSIPKGFPPLTQLCVCACVCARVLFPCTRRWGSSVTWQLIPRGCHDNYSCQAITKATGVILAQLVTPSNLWPLYKHSHTQRGWENARGTSVSRQACLEGCSWVLSHVFTISDFYVFWASRLLLLPWTEGVKDVKSASRWDYQFNF